MINDAPICVDDDLRKAPRQRPCAHLMCGNRLSVHEARFGKHERARELDEGAAPIAAVEQRREGIWEDVEFTRRALHTGRPFEEVVAALELSPPVVDESDSALLGLRGDGSQPVALPHEEMTKKVTARPGSSGFVMLMKVENAIIVHSLGGEHRSVRYAIGNPLIAEDVSDAAPEVCLYTPLRIAVPENEGDGTATVLFDSAESLMGSLGSCVARKTGSSLDNRLIQLAETTAGQKP